jgi:hypothetical protein
LAALAAGLLFYLAWSFKQTFVLGMIAGVLYLSWRRRWSAAIVLVTVTLALWGLTFAAMGPGYREVFRSTAAGSTYSLRVGIANTREMLLKTLPLWVLSLGFLASQSARRKLSTTPAAHSAVILGGICLLVVMPLAFAASCKIGAASNYFFDVPVALTLMAGGFLSGESFKRLENRETWIASAAFGGAAGIQVLALAGVMGTVSMAEQTRTQAAIWKVWKSQPEPRFSDLTSLNLPWLNASSPPIVRAFNYARERELGQAFEHKGVGGLIAEGYFRSLLLPSKTGDSYDEASLDGYERGETAQDFTVFHRKGAASPQ